MSKPSQSIIDKKDIRNVLRLLEKNWYVFIVFLGVALLYANYTIHKTTTIYRVSMNLLLKSETGDNLSDALIRGLGVSRRYEDIANELRIINSTQIIEKTLNKLNFEISYYLIGRIKTTEVFSNLPLRVEANIYSNELRNTGFFIEIVDTTRYELSYDYGGIQQVKKFRFDEPVITNDFTIVVYRTDIFRNTPIKALRDAKYMFRVNNKQHLVNKYKNSLSTRDLEWTSIVEVSVTDELPERGIQFLDTLGVVYIESSLELKKAINQNTLNFIDEQLAEVVGVLNSIEINLAKFKEDRDGLSLDLEFQKQYSKLQQGQIDKSKLEIQIAAYDYVHDFFTSRKDTVAFTPASADGFDPYLSQSLSKLNQSIESRSSLSFKAKKESPEYIEVERQINTQRSAILSYVANAKKVTQTKLGYLEGQIKQTEHILRGIPSSERDLTNINRRLTISEKMYLNLLEKRSETIIQRAGIVSNKKILESPKGAGIVRPDRQAILNNYLGIGLICALIVVFIRKLFFETIDTLSELKQLTDIPVIGAVNRERDGKREYLVVDRKPKSAIAESFRTIRNNLEYMHVEGDRKSILVTSSVIGEGKTFTSVNLATILAKAGKKTVILEMDLHRPKVHRVFGMLNDKGVSSYLVNKASLEDIIEHSGIENLDVCLAGPVPPNASELIVSGKIPEMISKLKEIYTYVIIDSPPVGIISDSVILMKYADINLYVLRSGTAKMKFVDGATTLKENVKPKNFGFILNFVKGRFGSYYYSEYTGGYGYGYGYSEA